MLSALVGASIRHYQVVIALTFLFLGYGVYRVLNASLDIFPEFSPKLVIVQTEAPGLTAEQVEALVTLPIEGAVGGLTDLESVRSQSIQGLSVVTLTFDDRTDLFRDRQFVAERLSLLADQLPEGIGPPVIVPLSSSSGTVMTIGLTSKTLDQSEIRALADWTLVPRLISVTGVADVNTFGGVQRQLQVQFDPERMRRHAVDVSDVVAAARGAIGVGGAGFVDSGNQRIDIRAAGFPQTAEMVAGIVLRHGADAALTLGDVAQVRYAAAPAISRATVRGEPAVVMMIIGQYQANTLAVTQNIEAALAELEPVFSRHDVTLHPDIFRPANYIEKSLENITGHLLVGAVLVILVLFIFLFNMRSALISAMAIPISLLAATVALIEAGVSINIMVLGGLAIALGEVVDDSIIDTENIFRRLRENSRAAEPASPMRIVYDASMEVRASVVYASFIVSLVFVPLLTISGVAGRMFAPLGIAYIVAIIASLVVAVTVTPALCTALLARSTLSDRDPPLIRVMGPRFAAMLRAIGKWGRLAIATVMIVCGIGIAVLPTLGSSFLPPLREGHYMIHTSSVPGTSLAETIRVGNQITSAVLEIPGVRTMSQWAGRAERGADTFGTHYAEYEVDLDAWSGREQQAILDRIRAILSTFPGIVEEVNTFLVERIEETISGYTAPVVINLYGQELEVLDRVALEVAAVTRTVSGAAEVQVRALPGTPVVEIVGRPEALTRYGLRPADVTNVGRAAFAGVHVGTIYDQGRGVEMAVILDPELRRHPDQIAQLPIRAANHQMLSLSHVAEIRHVSGRYAILHEDGRRLQTITAQVVGRDLGSFMAELRRALEQEVALPVNMYLHFAGSAVAQAESRRSLIANALFAGGGVVLLLFMAVGSVRNAILVLVNLPFSLVGGVAAAIWMGGVLSIGSLVGFVTLFGITVRNAIMLVSHYQHMVAIEGKIWSTETAIQGARERLPSILMTALVTGLALVPIAIDSDNPGREIMGPMAAIIIGGLISSTVLTLLLLPTIMARYGRFRPPDAEAMQIRKA